MSNRTVANVDSIGTADRTDDVDPHDARVILVEVLTR